MAIVELTMPKMGESIIEATILNWVKNVGDSVAEDETILEIATDKVDSEIPSPVSGVIKEILFEKDAVVEVGKVIAKISVESEDHEPIPNSTKAETIPSTPEKKKKEIPVQVDQTEEIPYVPAAAAEGSIPSKSGERFYSPLVRNIAKAEGISVQQLNSISGSGANGRVTKNDVLAFIAGGSVQKNTQSESSNSTIQRSSQSTNASSKLTSGGDEIVQMDRMRKLIADHMVRSKQTSPHVTSFVEADVTEIVKWRNAHKAQFQQQYGEKITFTPIFMEAVVKAIADFPLINVSVDGDNIIVKKNVNIGMATALPSGNLIVPVIKNADHLNLVGLTGKVNDLARRARENALKPDEISGGTFTLTNVGTFGNVMGTPIINQPQVAIMAVGAIRKKPAVLETPMGDVIAIRSMMFLSLSYDHRVVDGFLGGSFLSRVAYYMENFDVDRKL